MSTPSIRRASPSDADTIATMVHEIAAHQNEDEYVTVTVDRWRDLLGNDDVVVLLAERTGETVGYVSAVRRLHLWSGGNVLALDDLYVREHARDGGVGRALMIDLARYAFPQRLTITWGMRSENHGAQRFYTRLGASLRQKVVAAWDAETYAQYVTDNDGVAQAAEFG